MGWGRNQPGKIMKTNRSPHRLVNSILSLACFVLVIGAGFNCPAQDTAEPKSPDQPVPRRYKTPNDPVPQATYKSWSLFLVANPDWLLEQSNAKLASLYDQFNAFGSAIGRDNLAVWFWSQQPRKDHLREAIDTVRGAAICKLLKLKPSEGPYVLVMTTYPGECVMTDYPQSFPQSRTNLLIINLNGTDAAATGRLLNNLADKLVAEDLAALSPQRKDYWAGWRNAFAKLSDTVLGVASKVKVTVDSGPVKTEIKLGS
jgi:hypothetical protein